jgi:hypothetical protein
MAELLRVTADTLAAQEAAAPAGGELAGLRARPYAEYYLNPFKAAAPSFAVEAIAAPVHNTSELESVVTAQAREPNSGLILMPGDFAIANRVVITSLAARYPRGHTGSGRSQSRDHDDPDCLWRRG